MSGLVARTAYVWLLLAACGGAAGDRAGAQAQTPSAPLRAQEAPARDVLNAYLAAQAKLAADDYAGAHAAFERVRAAVVAPSLTLSPELRKRLDDTASACVAARDLAKARVALSPLTEALIAWLGLQSNPLGETLAVARCPMALGTGAKWLQLGAAIHNPYYGKEMLECGSIDARVAPGRKL
jgi:hypothetical protein